MTTHRYTVRKINLLPLSKFGCVLGGLAMLIPGLIGAVAATQVIAALRVLLEKWQESALDLLGMGVPVEFDFITLLSLGPALELVARLDDQRLVVALLIILTGVTGGGLLIGVTILLLGWFYNFLAAVTGGVEVELQEPQNVRR